MKRFHLREAELLNGRAAMAGRAWQRSPFSQESISLGLRCALCSSPEGKRCAYPTESFTWWRAGAPRILTQKPTIRRNQRTFRPKKSAPSGKGAQLRQHIDATLGSGNLREAVRLPPGEDFNEWLAVNSESALWHPH